uniref:Coiled-coil domain-containing protein 39 n=2 Tax=Eptatretus burgeri TaxID=7764 RepID=A0A8C4QH37_EPTBU
MTTGRRDESVHEVVRERISQTTDTMSGVRDFLAQFQWDPGMARPVANAENAALELKLKQRQEQKKHLQQDLQQQNERVQAMKKHLHSVHAELRSTQASGLPGKVVAAKTGDKFTFELELNRYLEVMEIEGIGMLAGLLGSLSIDGLCACVWSAVGGGLVKEWCVVDVCFLTKPMPPPSPERKNKNKNTKAIKTLKKNYTK